MSGRTILETPAISILAVDPGTCTGWAAFDGVSGRLFYDQWYGVNKADTNLTFYKLKAGKQPYALMMQRERQIARRLMDLVYWLGPRTVVVFEDFILGIDSNGRGGYGGRAGLSPVRITTSFLTLWDERCVDEGDLWRTINCGLLGWDGRGYHVGSEASATYWSSSLVAKVAMNRFREGAYGGGGAAWHEAQGASIKSSAQCTDAALKACGMWVPGRQHARDAMRHMRYLARGMGLRINASPEWFRQTARETKVLG